MSLPVSTFAITLRPLDGVTDTQIDVLTTFVKQRCKYYYIITEKENESRHVHAGVFLDKAVTPCNFRTLLLRKFRTLSDPEQRVFRKGIVVMFNSDWINKYLHKGDDTVVIAQSLPEAGHLESYYPPPLEATAGRARNSMNPYYAHLRTLWYQHSDPNRDINTENCRHFLFKMMYAMDLIKIIRDDKTIVQTARHLTRYLKKLEYSTIELPLYEHEE